MAENYVLQRPQEEFDPTNYSPYGDIPQTPMAPVEPQYTPEELNYIQQNMVAPPAYAEGQVRPTNVYYDNRGDLIQGMELDQMHIQPVGESGQSYIYPRDQRMDQRAATQEQALSQRINPISPLNQPPVVQGGNVQGGGTMSGGALDLVPPPAQYNNEVSSQGQIPVKSKVAGTREKAQGLYDRGAWTQKKALDEQSKIYNKLGNDINDALTSQEITRRDLQNEYTKKFNNMMQDLDDEYAKYEDQRIEKNGLFRDMGTGRRILSGIGLFMSAFSNSAMANTINIIDKAIQRDIDSQKNDMLNRKFSIQGKQNKLAYLTQKYENDVAAENALGAMQLKKVIDTIDSQLKRATTSQMKGKLDMMRGEFMLKLQEKVKKMSDFEKSLMEAQWANQRADDVTKSINLVFKDSPTERTAAKKEYAELKREKRILNQVDVTYKDVANGSLAKSYFLLSKENKNKKTIFAQLFGPFKALIQEAVSRGELETLEPFAPKYKDTREQILDKMNKFKRALVNNYKGKVYLPQAVGADIWEQIRIKTPEEERRSQVTKKSKSNITEKKPVFK